MILFLSNQFILFLAKAHKIDVGNRSCNNSFEKFSFYQFYIVVFCLVRIIISFTWFETISCFWCFAFWCLFNSLVIGNGLFYCLPPSHELFISFLFPFQCYHNNIAMFSGSFDISISCSTHNSATRWSTHGLRWW